MNWDNSGYNSVQISDNTEPQDEQWYPIKEVFAPTELVLGTKAEICPIGNHRTVKNETEQGGEGEEQKEDMEKKEGKNILKRVRRPRWDKLPRA